MDCREFHLFLITTNVVIILFMVYAIIKVLKEAAEEEAENRFYSVGNKIFPKIVPKQISALEAFSTFSLDLTRLISLPETSFTHEILNELQPIHWKVNGHLKRTEKLKITSAQAGKQKLSKLKFH